MTKKEIFEKLVELQEIVWRGDDRMDQDDLFELQDKLGSLVLILAKDTKQESLLIASFPWLYKEFPFEGE